MKLRNGSLKDFVPDHYPLGYMLVSYGREKYGDDFWKHVTHDAAAYKGLFYPFQRAIKKYAGVDYVTFRNKGLDFFKNEFEVSKPQLLNDLGAFRNEEFPSLAEDGSIIFVKSSFKQIPEFVIQKPNGDLQKIRTQDYTLYSYFSYRNGKIVYASYRPDI
jgi:hypothetical protein